MRQLEDGLVAWPLGARGEYGWKRSLRAPNRMVDRRVIAKQVLGVVFGLRVVMGEAVGMGHDGTHDGITWPWACAVVGARNGMPRRSGVSMPPSSHSFAACM